jgi:biotin-dependent carboxylase-like uncharacterized protein
MIEVLESGPLATVQDLGRPGYAALGVPCSGAFDRAALRLANRLVGNAEDAAGIEVTLGGLALVARNALTLALTGAACPGLDWGSPVTVPAGRVVRLGAPAAGLRSYLAVRGGIDAPAVLGSRSSDTLSGLGPAALRPGDELPVGAAGESVSAVSAAPRGSSTMLDVLLGPRDDWFTAAAVELFAAHEWTVRPDSDRVGLRLDGPVLDRERGGELPSEPTLPGAVQVPGDGRPIIFGPDAPVTGGYPVLAVLVDPDQAAQLRPGDPVRFRVRRGWDAGSPT